VVEIVVVDVIVYQQADVLAVIMTIVLEWRKVAAVPSLPAIQFLLIHR